LADLVKNCHFRIIDHFGAHKVIEALAPFVNEKRKKRIEKILLNRLGSIQLAIELPSNINNALAAVRSSEAFGISKIHIITPKNDTAFSIQSVTRGAFRWTEIIFHTTFKKFYRQIKAENYLLAGGVTDHTHTSLCQLPIENPLCILIGNERRGLSAAAKAECDLLYHIPIVGMSESLNLSVSAAISLYETSKRKRISIQCLGDLSLEARRKLKASYYMNSVNERLINTLFPKI